MNMSNKAKNKKTAREYHCEKFAILWVRKINLIVGDINKTPTRGRGRGVIFLLPLFFFRTFLFCSLFD